MTAFTVTGRDLQEAANWALRATPSRPTLPVLSGLLLDADTDADELVVTGYDMDTRATVVVPATITAPGQMLVSGKLLAAIAKTIKAGSNVTMAVDGGEVSVAADRASWSLPSMSPLDYPGLPDLGDPVGAVNAGDLRRALARVLPVLAKDDTLANLTCVKVVSEGDQLTLVGTDRFRLSVATIPWQPTTDEPLDLLIPGSLLSTASRAAGGDTDLVSIACSASGFGLAGDTTMVTGRLSAQDYVRWRNVAAQPTEHTATVEVAPLVQAIDQALVAADSTSQVELEFDSDGVKVSAADQGRRAHSWAPAELVGDDFAFRANSGYLRDALQLHDCDEVTIHFGSSPAKPMLVVGADGGYQHTLVPVRKPTAQRAAA
jgi:DNA polymerase-3 subunit beta